MENLVVAFPLLHLPSSAQQRVTRQMDRLSQLAFSILSKKTTLLIKSLNLQVRPAELFIRYNVSLYITFPDYCELILNFNYGDGKVKSVDKAPQMVHVRYTSEEADRRRNEEESSDEEDSDEEKDEDAESSTDDEDEVNDQADERGDSGIDIESKWKTHLTLREWLHHILNIYHESYIEKLEFFTYSHFCDYASIKTALQGIDLRLLIIERLYDEELFKKITKQLLPIAKSFVTDFQPKDIDHFQRVLLSNFNYFGSTVVRASYYKSLDRFLTINASTISIDPSPMTDKDINRFLKLWISGAMPRLRQLFLYIWPTRNAVKKNVVMNGITYTERGQEEKRSGMFECKHGPRRVEVEGGLNIVRRDGVEATIWLAEQGENVAMFEFYVWN